MGGRRETGFSDDQIEELLERTAKAEPLTKVCADPRMPSRSTVYEWIDKDHDRFNPEFAGRFRVARAQGVHALAEECLEIADTPASDAVQVADKRVRIDARLRLAGKWLPDDYGERLTHAGDKNAPLRAEHSIDLSNAPDEVLRYIAGQTIADDKR